MRLGMIGVGVMGQAIARRLLEKPPWDDLQLYLCDLDISKADRYHDYPNVYFNTDISALTGCDLIILAVKPQGAIPVLQELAKLAVPAIISIVAGITLEELVKFSNTAAIRVMPNTPSLIGEGISVLTYSADVSAYQKEQAKTIFMTLGEVVELEEKFFSVVTALSGAGPAYVYLMIEALIDAACAHGLSRDVAKQLVVSTFIGSAKLVEQSQLHPAILKDQVTSPGGVTISALHVMEQRGLRGILWDAVSQGVAKANDLK